MAKILIIEDEPLIQDFIKINLHRQGYATVAAVSGEEGLVMVENEQPDLVVLDIRLPGIDGFEVCRRLRQSNSGLPVLMLTARGEDTDKILGLELGADDYLTKPFNPRELVARINAILRRIEAARGYHPVQTEQVLNLDLLKLDLPRRIVKINGKSLELTPKEYDLLVLLARDPGKTFSRNEILNALWGEDFFGDPKTVDVHIRRLREKVEADPNRTELILTSWGVGYRLLEAANV